MYKSILMLILIIKNDHLNSILLFTLFLFNETDIYIYFLFISNNSIQILFSIFFIIYTVLLL